MVDLSPLLGLVVERANTSDWQHTTGNGRSSKEVRPGSETMTFNQIWWEDIGTERGRRCLFYMLIFCLFLDAL